MRARGITMRAMRCKRLFFLFAILFEAENNAYQRGNPMPATVGLPVFITVVVRRKYMKDNFYWFVRP